MKGVKENKFYVYVYCNSLLPGNYSFIENGIGISFEYEPFYIGKGSGMRILVHKKEAEKLKESQNIMKSTYNMHKINKINKIIENKGKIILYKICVDLNYEAANLIERLLIKLVGRKDKEMGPLTNKTDGGDGGRGFTRTKETEKKRVATFKNNISKIPDYEKRKKEKEINTKKNSEGGYAKIKGNISKSKTPGVIKRTSEKIKEFNKNNPEVRIQARQKDIAKKKENPDIMKQAGIKQSITKKKRKTLWGKSHFSYQPIEYKILIPLYFQGLSVKKMNEEYNKMTGCNLQQGINKFFAILDFPKGDSRKPLLNQVRLKFVEENKHKIDWYIDNYDQLEEEYYNKKWEEKYGGQ